MRFLVLVGLSLMTSFHAYGAKFANQFVEFELPGKWACNLEGAEWICQGADEAKKREAIIILAAKLKGEQDSLDQYLNYLKKPKVFEDAKTGKPVKSEPKYAKTENINEHPWVDSLHMESEIPGYYTRYLATIKQDIGVLVTYSVRKDQFQNYSQDFNTMVSSLKVFRKAGVGLNVKSQGSDLFKNTSIPTDLSAGSVFPVADSNETPASNDTGTSGTSDFIFYGLVAAAAVGFIIWRRKRAS